MNIEEQYNKQLEESNNFYNNVLSNNEKLYNQQQEYANNWETTQNEILDKQLAYNTDLINQQKEEAKETTRQETNKALNDYSAYVNPYGYQAERLAQNGLSKSGANTSSQLGAYTTYQNRVSAANSALQKAITSYDNDINAAILQNDVSKAENALNKLKLQLDYATTYYSNYATYGQNQLANNQDLYNNYVSQNQWEKTFAENQRQYETNLAEEQRQFDEKMAYQKEQDALAQSNWEKEYNLSRAKAYSGSSGGSKSQTSYTGYDLVENELNEDAYVNGVKVVKNPFTGEYNKDAQYGVFNKDNSGEGYQPDNIGGTKLGFTEYTVKSFTGTTGSTNSGGKNIDNQKVYKIGNTYYTWDGYDNNYVAITNLKDIGKQNKKYSAGGGGTGAYGGGGGGSR